MANTQAKYPLIRTAGVDGMLVSFGDALDESGNRAALAFRAALDVESWDYVEETTTSLVSCYIRFDPLNLPHATLQQKLKTLLSSQDWYNAPLPGTRRRWRIPCVFEGDHAPQLEQAAKLAGKSKDDAIASLTATPVTVQTIGFAPGMPYLGQLTEDWNIPRQTQLTKRIPKGALAVAIRQLVIFPITTPTGWMHIGQTALNLFQPKANAPFLLRPGDEVHFAPVSANALENLRKDANGGAELL